jgi:hypothetical protein
MGILSKIFCSKEERRIKEIQDQMNQGRAVISRLFELVGKGVISEDDISTDFIMHEGEKMPRIVVTIERLQRQGYLIDVEQYLMNFCYNIGASVALKELIKKKE